MPWQAGIQFFPPLRLPIDDADLDAIAVVVPVEGAGETRGRLGPVVGAEPEADRFDFALLAAKKELHVVFTEGLRGTRAAEVHDKKNRLGIAAAKGGEFLQLPVERVADFGKGERPGKGEGRLENVVASLGAD